MSVTLNIHHKAAPREHLMFSEHMTEAAFDHPIRETFLGQAHIAGTGPEGTTCRQCVFWRKIGFRKQDGKYVEYTKDPAYFSAKHRVSPYEIKKQYCTRPILNKAKRLIPHSAKSYRLFEENASAPIAKREPK